MATVSRRPPLVRIPLMSCSAALVSGGNGGEYRSVDAFLSCLVSLFIFTTAASPFCNLEFVRHVYGSGLAMRLATEQKIAREQDLASRAPGLESSNLFEEIVSGRDTTIDFSDYLALPQHRPAAPMENPHVLTERRLGMQI